MMMHVLPHPIHAQLEAGDMYTHRLTLVFFYKGSYQLDMKAYITKMKNNNSSTSLSNLASSVHLSREETDGEVVQTYMEERMTSPISERQYQPPSLLR